MMRILRSTFDLLAHSYWLVTSESFSHIDHAALALSVTLLQLLAAGREGVEKGLPKAVGWFVALNKNAVRVLETDC